MLERDLTFSLFESVDIMCVGKIFTYDSHRRKPVFGVFDHVRQNQAVQSTEDCFRLERSDLKVKEFYNLCSENKGAPVLRLCKKQVPYDADHTIIISDVKCCHIRHLNVWIRCPDTSGCSHCISQTKGDKMVLVAGPLQKK